MHGQAELPRLHHHPPRPYCSQAATMDPQDCSLPSACLAAQMPQGTKNSKPVKCDGLKLGPWTWIMTCMWVVLTWENWEMEFYSGNCFNGIFRPKIKIVIYSPLVVPKCVHMYVRLYKLLFKNVGSVFRCLNGFKSLMIKNIKTVILRNIITI